MQPTLDGGGSSKTPATTVAGVNLLPGLGLMGAIMSGAVEIVLDAAQIATINGHLDEAEQFLVEARGKLAEVPGGAVGGSPVGQQLAHHSKLANEALLDTLKSMEKGVVYYRDSIKMAVDKMTGADEGAGAAARRGESYFPSTPSQGGA